MLKKSKEAVEEEASKSESDAEDEEVAYGFVIYNDKPDALAAVAKDGHVHRHVTGGGRKVASHASQVSRHFPSLPPHAGGRMRGEIDTRAGGRRCASVRAIRGCVRGTYVR